MIQFALPAAAALLGNEERFRQILEALPVAIYTTDAEGRITYYNKAAAELAGREPVLGSDRWCVTWRLYRPDGTPLPHDECPMAIALKENRAIRGVEAIAERPDGTRVPLLGYPSPLRDESGKLVGAVNMLVDISERKDAEARQRALMNELNHRVKNNMQMLQSLLGAAQRETGSEEARTVLADAVGRVGAMAAAQHALYSAGATSFEARSFLEALCRNASQAFGRQADIEIEAASGVLSNDAAVPLALIVNELIANAVQHGKGVRSRVSVKIGLVNQAQHWVLHVEDDGPGFTPQPAQRRATGLGLVMGLARQLGGTFDVTTTRGARCVVRFGGPRSAKP